MLTHGLGYVMVVKVNQLRPTFTHGLGLCTDPFYWAWLPLAKVPFSDDIAFLVVPKLKDNDFVQSLVEELRAVFKVSLLIM